MNKKVGATRWGDRRRADSDFAREQILDAAVACYERAGVHKTTMEHIARQAKVTRTTVYRYFQSRGEVLNGVIMRATLIMVMELQRRVAETRGFGEFIVEAAFNAYELIPASPVLRLLLSEDAPVLHRVYVTSSEVLNLAVEFLRPRFEEAVGNGELRDSVELITLTDWVIHVISAYLLAPPNPLCPTTDLREALRRYLEPALLRAEAGTGSDAGQQAGTLQ